MATSPSLKPGRSGAGAKIDNVSKRKAPIIPLVIGGIVVIAIGAFLMNDPNKEEREFGKSVESADARAQSTARGQQGAFNLADSTNVKLAPETAVKIPPGFNAQVHGILVQGAVALTIKPVTGEKALPFRVKAKKSTVASKGGVLLVRSYDDEPTVYVMAKEGDVVVRPNVDEKETKPLTTGQAMSIDAKGATKMLSADETATAFSWVDGNYTLTATPLNDVLPVLQRWYNTQAKIFDKSLEARPVTAVLKLSSSKDALDEIGKAANVHIQYRGDTLTLADGAPSAANKVPAKAPKKGK